MSSLRRFALWVMGFDVVTVLWGALVRATGSGAGCGAHWPLCNGVVFPRSPTAETLVEMTHRLTGGVALVLVFALVIWSLRVLPRGHAGRMAALTAGAFIVLEALVGAALVLFGWVGNDNSAARGGAVVVHLVNTFLLLGSLALTAALVDGPGRLTVRGRGPLAAAMGLALATVVVSGATGAVAALGDTLYPAASVASGLAEDLREQAPFLLRLRLVHPFTSLASALVLVVIARAVLQAREQRLRSPALRLLVLLGLQLLAGALNVVLLAPIWLQIVHLGLADVTWIALVMLAAASLSSRPEAVPSAVRTAFEV
ncbi:MAG TPA: COX15/CtaA family protein [Anaeromyxobacter sp.]|nr:COX15/CtaA family protein [Anaeromyxobacter sp.]